RLDHHFPIGPLDRGPPPPAGVARRQGLRGDLIDVVAPRPAGPAPQGPQAPPWCDSRAPAGDFPAPAGSLCRSAPPRNRIGGSPARSAPAGGTWTPPAPSARRTGSRALSVPPLIRRQMTACRSARSAASQDAGGT